MTTARSRCPRDPHRERRRRAVRRAALAERRELGDGDPRPEGGRAVHPGRRGRPARGRRARPRPGASFVEHKGAVRRPRARCPTARSSTPRRGEGAARGRRRHGRGARRRWCPRALEAAEGLGRDGVAARSSTCGRWCRSTPRRSSLRWRKTGRLVTVEENPRLCGWGAEVASIVAEEAVLRPGRPDRAASRRRTSRCRRPTRSRTWRSPRPSASSKGVRRATDQ